MNIYMVVATMAHMRHLSCSCKGNLSFGLWHASAHTWCFEGLAAGIVLSSNRAKTSYSRDFGNQIRGSCDPI